jgi:hypothetical protein
MVMEMVDYVVWARHQISVGCIHPVGKLNDPRKILAYDFFAVTAMATRSVNSSKYGPAELA